MKQLKFMLAAATAVGIAAAAQADTPYATSTGFERAALGNVGTGTFDYADASNSYFFYDGESETGDNESAIEGASAPVGANDRPEGYKKLVEAEQTQKQVLHVNTGTNALLRTISPLTVASGKWTMPEATELTEDVYVDTLVQFTVTPVGDPVTPGVSDKLMVYLQESATETEGVTVTNLMVKGGFLDFKEEVLTFSKESYKLFFGADKKIEANSWYRLTVKMHKNIGNSEARVAFSIFIDGVQGVISEGKTISDSLANNEAVVKDLFAESYIESVMTGSVILSLLDDPSATLQAVGFAGEGYVDDFIVTTNDPNEEDPTSVDFTFSGEKLSSVTYTIGNETNTVQARVKTTLASASDITITSIVCSDLYTVDSTSTYKVGDTVSINAANMTLPIITKAVIAENGTVSVPNNTKPADIGISQNTGIPATIDTTKLNAIIGWANAKKGSSTAIATVNSIEFDENGNPAVSDSGATTNLPAQAYLLNCDIDQEAVETAKAAFKFEALTFTVNGLPDLDGIAKSWGAGENAKSFNGKPVLDYKSSLTAAWGEPPASLTAEDAKTGFFRARLVLDTGATE